MKVVAEFTQVESNPTCWTAFEGASLSIRCDGNGTAGISWYEGDNCTSMESERPWSANFFLAASKVEMEKVMRFASGKCVEHTFHEDNAPHTKTVCLSVGMPSGSYPTDCGSGRDNLLSNYAST